MGLALTALFVSLPRYSPSAIIPLEALLVAINGVDMTVDDDLLDGATGHNAAASKRDKAPESKIPRHCLLVVSRY
jgi:hypothetical protein